jgi:hypothetical protein
MLSNTESNEIAASSFVLNSTEMADLQLEILMQLILTLDEWMKLATLFVQRQQPFHGIFSEIDRY